MGADNLPLVSVVIPAYNSGKYIGQCLDSLIAQTYRNWEAWIILAPSTDDTWEKILEYSDPRLHLVDEQKKTTCSQARNHGFAYATGEYIAFMDSDDWWYPDKLGRQVAVLEFARDIQWCASQLMLEYENGTSKIFPHYPGKVVEGTGVQSILFRRGFLVEDIYLNGGHLFDPYMDRQDDNDLVLRVRDYPSLFLETPLVHFRQQPGSLSAKTEHWKSAWNTVKMAIRHKAWFMLPFQIKNVIIYACREKIGIDLIQLKKKVTR